jgi:hypothetical protein
VGYYSVIKRDEVLMCATVRMNFENMLNEISQTQIVEFYLHEISKIDKFTETQSKLEVTTSWRKNC